jgi:hypothetical protein
MSNKCARMKCEWSTMLKGCLVFSSMRLGGPFYSPKAARSRWEHFKKAILAFCRLAHRTVRYTTGHCPVRISFLIWRSRPLQIPSRWRTGHCPVHTGQSGAPFWPLALPRVARGFRGRPLARLTVGSPDTVRCPLLTVGSATRRARIPRPTVGPALSGAPPDTVRCT